MPETCIFCGAVGEAFPPEHWVSAWISRKSVARRMMVEHHTEDSAQPWYARAFEITVQRVCPDCNHHWMSDIESRVQPIALGLIRGTKDSLTSAEQSALARWCFLKAITLELGRPRSGEHPPTYPDRLYAWFHEHREPPPRGCAISIGRRDPEQLTGSKIHYAWFKSEGKAYSFPGIGDVSGYRTDFGIGELVVDVIGIFADARLQLDDDDERFVRIGPVDLPSDRFQVVDGNRLI